MTKKRKVFFSWTAVGDALVLLCAAWNYYRLTGEKPLIGLENTILAKYCPFIEIVEWVNFKNFTSNNRDEYIKKAEKNNYEPVFLGCKNTRIMAADEKTGTLFWGNEHLVGGICSSMGLNGEIDLSIPFSDDIVHEVKESNYVCVMTGGIQKYKYVAPEQMQPVIDYLSKRFTVVQIGGARDPLLKGVKDYRNHTLLDAWNLLHFSKFFVGSIGGLMHMAKFAGTRAAILQTSAEPDSLINYSGNIYIKPRNECTLCRDGLVHPTIQPCFFKYKCIRNIKAEDVILQIEKNFERLCSKAPVFDRIIVKANSAKGLEQLEDAMRLLQYVGAHV